MPTPSPHDAQLDVVLEPHDVQRLCAGQPLLIQSGAQRIALVRGDHDDAWARAEALGADQIVPLLAADLTAARARPGEPTPPEPRPAPQPRSSPPTRPPSGARRPSPGAGCSSPGMSAPRPGASATRPGASATRPGASAPQPGRTSSPPGRALPGHTPSPPRRAPSLLERLPPLERALPPLDRALPPLGWDVATGLAPVVLGALIRWQDPVREERVFVIASLLVLSGIGWAWGRALEHRRSSHGTHLWAALRFWLLGAVGWAVGSALADRGLRGLPWILDHLDRIEVWGGLLLCSVPAFFVLGDPASPGAPRAR